MPIVLGNPQNAYNCAHVFLKLHGTKAEKLALDRMVEFVRKNDIVAAGLWLSIANVIQELSGVHAHGLLH
jgi:hypothetical protein